MRQKLGTFRYPVDVVSAGGQRSERHNPWVDTGALYSQFPEGVLVRLGYQADASRRFRLADRSICEMPIGDVRVRIGDEVRSVTCVFGEDGGEVLLGATTLEAFSLEPDPVNETLNPIVAMLL